MNKDISISLSGSTKKDSLVTKTLKIEEELWEQFNELSDKNDGVNRTTCFNELLKAGFLYLKLKEELENENIFENGGFYYHLASEDEDYNKHYFLDEKFTNDLNELLKEKGIDRKELFQKIDVDINSEIYRNRLAKGFYMSFGDVELLHNALKEIEKEKGLPIDSLMARDNLYLGRDGRKD